MVWPGGCEVIALLGLENCCSICLAGPSPRPAVFVIRGSALVYFFICEEFCSDIDEHVGLGLVLAKLSMAIDLRDFNMTIIVASCSFDLPKDGIVEKVPVPFRCTSLPTN
jgi:hypothetical protein